MAAENDGRGSAPLETRPGVLLIGSPNVGKRTLLSRLISIDFPDTSDLSTGILCQGWTIETKYYTAELSIWTANLDEGFTFGSLPIDKQLDALVMVFDLSDVRTTLNESTLTVLKDWVAKNDITNFEILLCIGNKADLVSGHYAYTEYRRRMQKRGESNSDPHPEYVNYGIDETEGCSLLGHEESSLDVRKLCLDWCIQHNIEYLEACASNADFDKCLSVDGDMQGVDRLYGALSAHMWPGMILKSGNKITNPSLVEKEESTDDESDFEIEYEALSHGSDGEWGTYNDTVATKSYNETEEINHNPSSDTDVKVETSTIPSTSIPMMPSNLGSGTGNDPDTQNNFVEKWEKFEDEISIEQRPRPNCEEQELGSDISTTELAEDEWGTYNDAVATKSYNETEEINHNPSSDTHVKVETSTIPSTSIPMKPSNLGSGTENDPDTQNLVEKWEKFEDEISIEQRPRPNCEEQELGSDISTTELAEDAYHGLDDLESLMYEIGNMRDNLRLMPDFQRREMAAKLAMKMASMFADDTDDEVGL